MQLKGHGLLVNSEPSPAGADGCTTCTYCIRSDLVQSWLYGVWLFSAVVCVIARCRALSEVDCTCLLLLEADCVWLRPFFLLCRSVHAALEVLDRGGRVARCSPPCCTCSTP